MIENTINLFHGFHLRIVATLSFVFNLRRLKGIDKRIRITVNKKIIMWIVYDKLIYTWQIVETVCPKRK